MIDRNKVRRNREERKNKVRINGGERMNRLIERGF